MTVVRISDLTIEQYRLGELDATDRARLEAEARYDASLRARLQCLDASDHAIHESGDVRRLVAQLGSVPVATSTSSPRRLAWSAVGVLSMAVALIAVANSRSGDDRPGAPAAADLVTDRIKGDAVSMWAYRRDDGGGERLENGATAREGDVIRLAYRVTEPTFGVIVSLDGAGVVTRHLPLTGDTAAPLAIGDATLLDSAYELDAAPRWERFFLITRDRPFAIDPVLAAARSAAAAAAVPEALPLPTSFTQATFQLTKRP